MTPRKAMQNVQHRVAEFLAALRQRNASPNTIAAYGKDLAKFQEYIAGHYAGQLEGVDHVSKIGRAHV